MTTQKTPMMKQYEGIKNRYPDSILFFRLGDFYEMFNNDAITASKELDITLTTRNKNKENAVPLCGIPHHSADSYITKLVKKGYKVAICEQKEDPRDAKGIVKREVIRVVTPGTHITSSVTDDKENNFLLSIFPYEGRFGYALLDISTGEFNINEYSDSASLVNIHDEITKNEPKEVLLPKRCCAEDIKKHILPLDLKAAISPVDDHIFDYSSAYQRLTDHFNVPSLSIFGCDNLKLAASAAGAALYYIKETQKADVSHINRLVVQNDKNYMQLDASTVKNMELLKRDYYGTKEGSLFGLLDLTVTAMGGRKCRRWISRPLTEKKEICERLLVVEELKNNYILRKEIRKLLSHVYDLERIISRVNMQQCNARDLVSLKNSFEVFSLLKAALKDIRADYLKRLGKKWDTMTDLYDLLDRSIVDDPPVSFKNSGIVKAGYSEELDHLKGITKDGRGKIAELEAFERERTGINTLKIRYNNIYGYYIEVTKRYKDSIPEDYIRKQSLSNSERFVSQRLKEYEEEISSAQDRIVELEHAIFEDIRLRVSCETERIQKMAHLISELDIFSAFSEASYKYNFKKPVVNESDIIRIVGGRHPVVEHMSPDETFIPNDTLLDLRDNKISIITGPNMAGKSTYLRQTGLIVLLAQIGCFVPAESAEIGIVDRIFTRIGAHDDLVKGHSTFMVEMSETANILHNATSKSLIILDEIGRGTSTFDGISIAWSVVEYIDKLDKIGVRTLFATHYFELTELEDRIKGINNFSVSIKENKDNIIFLRKIKRGRADKSYGIQVAKLAGLPERVIEGAEQILLQLEDREGKKDDKKISFEGQRKDVVKLKGYKQLDLFKEKGYDPVVEELRTLRIEELTPLDAINKLNELKTKIINCV